MDKTITFFLVNMVLCLGPNGSGKTLLLKKLQNYEEIDLTTNTVPSVGTNIFTILSPDKSQYEEVTEIGGSVASIWKKYYKGVRKIMYVVDASNLCQISAAGILLYELLVDPATKNAKILLILTKMDVSYRQMRNEALLMLQYAKLKDRIPQQISVVEASPISGEGISDIVKWLFNIPIEQKNKQK